MIIISLLFGFFVSYPNNRMVVSAFEELPLSEDVTYVELKSFQTSCPGDYDNCKASRFGEDLTIYTCMCEESCVNLRTCCVDSAYRDVKPTVAEPYCRSLSETRSLFMVEQCPRGSSTDSAFRQECEAEANKEDLLSYIPVTSSTTGINYKNYFCFKCNEDHSNFVYWNLKLTADIDGDTEIQNANIVPVYDSRSKQWLAPVGQYGDQVSVNVTTEVPSGVSHMMQPCVPNVISDCPDDWDDDEVRQKCKAYTAYVTVREETNYRNPHCAMCHFEDISELRCYQAESESTAFGAGKKPFSFTHLLDINRSDGDKVGQIQRCGDDSTWDPFFKKCRTLKCALPGYVVKNGKCAAN